MKEEKIIMVMDIFTFVTAILLIAICAIVAISGKIQHDTVVYGKPTEQEVLAWADEHYGSGSYVSEVIPYADSLVTDHTGGRQWHNGLDPDAKVFVLANGDTMVVVGPKLVKDAQKLIEACRISHAHSCFSEVAKSENTISTE